MEERSNRVLDPLPASDDPFWGEAKRELVNIKKQREMAKQKGCEHYFEKIDNRVECTKCGIGYFAKPDEIVKDGHLYKDDQLII